MPYRALEYVPEVFQPDDRRISDLIYAQSNIEANRMRDNGLTQLAMWRGMGNAASGALSDLAKYKREAPARAEAERVRKEKDKLRGLEQFAGGYVDPVTGEQGMTEEARGKLLKKEGFVEKGQDILDKDSSRKATEAVYKDAQDKRNRDEMSEITFALDQIRESADPVAAYNSNIKGLKEKWKGKLDDMPDVHDQGALDKKVTSIQRASDVAARNARAEASSKKLREEGKEFNEYVDAGIGMMKPVIRDADTQPEWDAMWSNFDARTKHLPEATRKRIEDAMPYKRQFSKEQWQQAVELGEDKTPTSDASAVHQMFVERYGHAPKSAADEAILNQMLASRTRATHVPSQVDARAAAAEDRRAAAFKQGINKQKNDKLLALNAAFSKEDITEEQLLQGKEDVQAWYLDQIGAADGPSLSQIERDKGFDLMGRPLSAQAQPGAARPQQPVAGRPQAGAGVLPEGMVMVRNPETGATGGLPLEQALEIEKKSGQSIIIGDRSGRGAGLPVKPPAAPAAPAAPVTPAAPPAPPKSVEMLSPNGVRKIIEAKDVEQMLKWKWKIAPPPPPRQPSPAEDVASRVYRDMTVGAPSRSTATPRR